MKRLLCTFVSLLIVCSITYSQQLGKQLNAVSYPELVQMSGYDSLKLSQLPILKLSNETKMRLIPYAIDNSLQPWFRPLFSQSGLECGQASSIGLVFTYEMDYIRNVPANLPENQYATYFAYNFINGGSDNGVSFYETYEILKYAGNPTVEEYGGLSTGGPSRWMNGYDLYYNSMHNRVSEVYSIKLNTVDGLQTLKNWLYDHGDGSSAGGVACFYAQYTNPNGVFPENVPEAGKHVITAWGGSANHAMTFAGYNDSIRWDYNNDGQYTNHIDLNLDGIIDIRDWEIGGFKIANTYGSINYWGDHGFSYVMYKSVADAYGQGGIWNNTGVVIDVRDDHQPQLTAKVSLNYLCRNKVKVMAGVSSNPVATEPDHILHFPMFDFQGGCLPMAGSSGSQTIEFGLDLNLLLQYVNPGEPAKYFLIIQEDDPLGAQTGILESFSLIDYTNGSNIINSNVSGLPLVNNSITTVGVTASINFNPVLITDDTIPTLQLYSSYYHQLQGNQGTPPYRWQLVEGYSRVDSTSTMPLIDAIKLQPSSSNNGHAKVELPFDFPFYGKLHNEVYATVDGYLMFEDNNIPWPFYIEGRTYFIETPMIAPVCSHPLLIGTSTEGIWYEESADYVTFRWKLSAFQSSGSEVNATARLYPDGRIDINYGSWTIPSYIERYAGVSSGDGENYYIMTYDPDFSPLSNQFVRFTPNALHSGIELTTEGVLMGQVNELFDSIPILVCATDKNNLKDYKTYYLTSKGLLIEYEIFAGDNNIIGFGEDVYMDLLLTNYNSFPVGATTINLSSLDQYYNIITSQTSFAGLAAGESIIIPNAFHFKAHNNIPNGYMAQFVLNAQAPEGNWSRVISLDAYRAITEINSITIDDGDNGILEPGETAFLNIDLVNSGGAELTDAIGILQSWYPHLTVNTNSNNIDTLQPGQIWTLSFEVSLAPEAPEPDLIEINIIVNGNNEFYYIETIPLFSGLLVEDFETGDFSMFEWLTAGTNPWFTETGTAYEGSWCARSGSLLDNQFSTLYLDWDVAHSDTISFWYKVSSEPSYDFLFFSTTQGELARWSGSIDWTQAKFPLPAGPNTFIWKYGKDYSISTDEDCARIDYITFPAYSVPTPTVNNEISGTHLSVYPNPGSDVLNIMYTLEKPSPVRVYIIDMHGRIIYQKNEPGYKQEGEYLLKPDWINNGPGIYSVILHTNSGILVKKIIKISN
jgi:hypothetical protein